MKFIYLALVFSFVIAFICTSYTVKAESSDKIENINVDKIINNLPKDFSCEAYRQFLNRANNTLVLFVSKNEQELAFHPVIVENPHFSDKDRDIVLEYQYIPVIHRTDSSKQWIVRKISITWGKNYTIEHKDDEYECSILFGRACDRFVYLVIIDNSIFSYTENFIPDQSHGYILVLQKDKKSFFDIDFERGFKRILELDNKEKVIDDKKTPYEIIKNDSSSEKVSSLLKKNYFSLDTIVIPSMPISTNDEKIKSKLTEINELVLSVQKSMRKNFLKHNILLKDNTSDISLKYCWKQDGTLKFSVEQSFKKNDDILGYSMTFYRDGYLHLYREGNVPSIRNIENNFKFTGTEIKFYENGFPAVCRSFDNGKILNQIKWSEQKK